MATFIAYQPYLLGELGGLKRLISIRNVKFDDRENDGFTAKWLDSKLYVGGHGFKYFLFQPRAEGTVTSLKYVYKGEVVYKLTGADVDLRDIIEGTSAEATQKFLAGNDRIMGSSGNDNLSGGRGNDRIAGKDGDDILSGQKGDDVLVGGPGEDRLNGGSGRDTYFFKVIDEQKFDVITAFDKHDRIALSGKVFGLELGPLAEEHFVLGAVALEEDDRILFNQVGGGLFFDPDGTGPVGPTKLAALPANLKTIDVDDFFVI